LPAAIRFPISGFRSPCDGPEIVEGTSGCRPLRPEGAARAVCETRFGAGREPGGSLVQCIGDLPAERFANPADRVFRSLARLSRQRLDRFHKLRHALDRLDRFLQSALRDILAV